MRQDLLALTPDDLVTLSNRGIVKRAQRELERATVTVTITESETGAVTAVASDNTTCTIAAGTTLADSHCTCSASAATTCRHLIRTVLAYQLWAATQTAKEPAKPLAPWDPGNISDDALTTHFPKATLNRIREQFTRGHVVELVRSGKPTARIHTLSCTVRFLVPGDFRYTHCDCAEPAPCSHVPLAIWAFRRLSQTATSGLVETHHETLPVPYELLDEIEQGLIDLAELGIAGASATLSIRIQRLATRCDQAGLVWPGDILEEIAQEYGRYHQHDARFSPIHIAQLIGELLIRCRTIRQEDSGDETAVPAIFVRGSQQDHDTRVGSARFVGLGCGVEIQQHSVILSAYLQDADSGVIVAIQKEVADPLPATNERPLPFWQIADQSAFKGASLAKVAASKSLIKGGTRTAHYTIRPGRAPASATPQQFEWDQLRSPALAEDFAEIRARQQLQPPGCLRPRRVGENLFVCRITKVDQIIFHEAAQEITAVLHDSRGDQALLYHPYTNRGAEGTEALLWWLHHHPDQVQFISGQVRIGYRGLIFQPLGLVFEVDGQRQLVQPWVDRWQKKAIITMETTVANTSGGRNPRYIYPTQVLAALGELFQTGFRRIDATAIRQWQALVDEGASYGFNRFIAPIQALHDQLANKQSQLDWDWQSAVTLALDTAVIARFAQENIAPLPDSQPQLRA